MHHRQIVRVRPDCQPKFLKLCLEERAYIDPGRTPAALKIKSAKHQGCDTRDPQRRVAPAAKAHPNSSIAVSNWCWIFTFTDCVRPSCTMELARWPTPPMAVEPCTPPPGGGFGQRALVEDVHERQLLLQTAHHGTQNLLHVALRHAAPDVHQELLELDLDSCEVLPVHLR